MVNGCLRNMLFTVAGLQMSGFKPSLSLFSYFFSRFFPFFFFGWVRGIISAACTDRRPRARWYQLRRLPSLARNAFVLNAIVVSLSHGEVPNHGPSAFTSTSPELTRNTNRTSGTPATAISPTVKCPMVRPQRYSTLQKPIRGYQPQVGSDIAVIPEP